MTNTEVQMNSGSPSELLLIINVRQAISVFVNNFVVSSKNGQAYKKSLSHFKKKFLSKVQLRKNFDILVPSLKEEMIFDHSTFPGVDQIQDI